jgi:hypothetical protein
MSPVEICTEPSTSVNNFATVPLPAPGAPKSINFTNLTPLIELQFLSADRILRVPARWAILRQLPASINLLDKPLIYKGNSIYHRGRQPTSRASCSADGRLSRFARRDPHNSAIVMVRLLARGLRASPEAPTVGALTLLCDAESVNISLKKYLMANFNAVKIRTFSIHAFS